MREHSNNVGRYIVGLDPGRSAALVLLERIPRERVAGHFDGLWRWPNDVAVVATQSLSHADGLPTLTDRVCKILGGKPLEGDATLVVNVSDGDHAWRALLASGRVRAPIAMRIGTTDNDREHVYSEPRLWGDVRVALQQRRLVVADKLRERHAVISAVARESLSPGMATALAVAVQWWKLTSTTDCPVVTRLPSDADERRAFTADAFNRYQVEREQWWREHRQDFIEMNGQEAYWEDHLRRRPD
jgi:hypothetical protein